MAKTDERIAAAEVNQLGAILLYCSVNQLFVRRSCSLTLRHDAVANLSRANCGQILSQKTWRSRENTTARKHGGGSRKRGVAP
jgi:hypothetical protein